MKMKAAVLREQGLREEAERQAREQEPVVPEAGDHAAVVAAPGRAANVDPFLVADRGVGAAFYVSPHDDAEEHPFHGDTPFPIRLRARLAVRRGRRRRRGRAGPRRCPSRGWRS